jgi:TadE-like protein
MRTITSRQAKPAMRRSFRPATVLRASLRSSECGVSVVEFGLAAPFLVLLLIGLLDLGLGSYNWLQLRHAVAAGAQYAMVHGWTGGGGNIMAAVQGATSLTITFPPGSVTEVCACPKGTGGSTDSDLDDTIGVPVGDSCAGYTCSACTTWDGHPCPAGRYAHIHGQISYTPILPLFSPMTLASDAYGRME